MRKRIDARSILQGFSQSRLPVFTDEEKSQLKGTYDFLTANIYTSFLGQATDEADISDVSMAADLSLYTYQPDDWEPTVCSWIKVSL